MAAIEKVAECQRVRLVALVVVGDAVHGVLVMARAAASDEGEGLPSVPCGLFTHGSTLGVSVNLSLACVERVHVLVTGLAAGLLAIRFVIVLRGRRDLHQRGSL